jgi:hypothetical protein
MYGTLEGINIIDYSVRAVEEIENQNRESWAHTTGPEQTRDTASDYAFNIRGVGNVMGFLFLEHQSKINEFEEG